ncbi:MAG: ABC transporter permease [Actinomycetota bacterium]|nr:ABC transporter permease [Actinomycetota bacterium]
MIVRLLLRAAQMVLVVLAVVTIAFFVLRLATGDPARLINPPGTPEEVIAQTRERIGTDKPLFLQYGEYLLNLAQGDLGRSFRGAEPVRQAVLDALPNTVALAGIAVVVGAVLALLLGGAAAWRPNSLLDRSVLGYAALAQATPAFWLAVVLVLFFSLRLRWFPAIDMAGPKSFVLPVATLVVTLSPILVRTVRQSFMETLGEDFIRAARARGLPEWRVFLVHGLKIAALPLVTLIGLQLGFLLAGAVVVEAIFNWPGIGKLILDALASRDFPMIQGGVLVAAVAFVVLNFFVDLAYTLLDPRIRVGAQ